MIGNVRWNIILGMIAFVLTFIMSYGNNLIVRTLLHSVYSFMILFAAGFALRWILGTVVGLKQADSFTRTEDASEGLGAAVNEVTPDDQEQLNELLKTQLQQGDSDQSNEPFVPLLPKKLTSVTNSEPEEMAQALRRMTEE